MSVRDEIAQALHARDCCDEPGGERHSPPIWAAYLDDADAALAVVRSHRGRLADELEAWAEKAERDEDAARTDDAAVYRVEKFAVRTCARRLRALYEEQPK